MIGWLIALDSAVIALSVAEMLESEQRAKVRMEEELEKVRLRRWWQKK
jgi:hypothetical protein